MSNMMPAQEYIYITVCYFFSNRIGSITTNFILTETKSSLNWVDDLTFAKLH